MPIYIYALIDPRTDKIRYIGKTDNPKERYSSQLSDKSNTHRCHWIQSLLREGLKPIQRILEAMPDNSDWQEIEKWWIAEGRVLGWPLTNGTDGGDGLFNPPPEVIEKLRRANIGRKPSLDAIEKARLKNLGGKHTDAHKQKMRDSLLGREITPHARKIISQKVRKFTDVDIENVKDLLAKGVMVKDIADMYGVHRTTVSKIKKGKYPNG